MQAYWVQILGSPLAAHDSGKFLSPGRSADLRNIWNRAGAWQTPAVTAVLTQTVTMVSSPAFLLTHLKTRPRLAVREEQAREWEAARRAPQQRASPPTHSSNVFSVRVCNGADATASQVAGCRTRKVKARRCANGGYSSGSHG